MMSKLSYVWPLILDLVLHASCKWQHRNNAMAHKSSKYSHGCTGCSGSYSLVYVGATTASIAMAVLFLWAMALYLCCRLQLWKIAQLCLNHKTTQLWHTQETCDLCSYTLYPSHGIYVYMYTLYPLKAKRCLALYSQIYLSPMALLS